MTATFSNKPLNSTFKKLQFYFYLSEDHVKIKSPSFWTACFNMSLNNTWLLNVEQSMGNSFGPVHHECFHFQGGLKAVMWTDAFQMTIVFAGVMAVAIKGTTELGGFHKIWQIAQNGSKIHADKYVCIKNNKIHWVSNVTRKGSEKNY